MIALAGMMEPFDGNLRGLRVRILAQYEQRGATDTQEKSVSITVILREIKLAFECDVFRTPIPVVSPREILLWYLANSQAVRNTGVERGTATLPVLQERKSVTFLKAVGQPVTRSI